MTFRNLIKSIHRRALYRTRKLCRLDSMFLKSWAILIIFAQSLVHATWTLDSTRALAALHSEIVPLMGFDEVAKPPLDCRKLERRKSAFGVNCVKFAINIFLLRSITRFMSHVNSESPSKLIFLHHVLLVRAFACYTLNERFSLVGLELRWPQWFVEPPDSRFAVRTFRDKTERFLRLRPASRAHFDTEKLLDCESRAANVPLIKSLAR